MEARNKGARHAPRNLAGHDLSERSGEPGEPASQELPPEAPPRAAEPKAPRPAELTMPWGVRKTLADALVALEEGRLADARGLMLGCLGKPANYKPTATRYQELEKSPVSAAAGGVPVKVLEEVVSRVRLAQERLRGLDGKRLPKKAQEDLTTVRGGTLPSLLEYVEAQAALAGVELAAPGAEEGEEPEPEACGAPVVREKKLTLCARDAGHGGCHQSGDGHEWSDAESEAARKLVEAEEEEGSDPGREPEEDDLGDTYEWASAPEEQCLARCRLPGQERRVCERRKRHPGEEHAAPVSGEPPLVWRDAAETMADRARAGDAADVEQMARPARTKKPTTPSEPAGRFDWAAAWRRAAREKTLVYGGGRKNQRIEVKEGFHYERRAHCTARAKLAEGRGREAAMKAVLLDRVLPMLKDLFAGTEVPSADLGAVVAAAEAALERAGVSHA